MLSWLASEKNPSIKWPHLLRVSDVAQLLNVKPRTIYEMGGCKWLKTNGGAEGDRTPGLRIANAALCQTELLPHSGMAQVCNLRQR